MAKQGEPVDRQSSWKTIASVLGAVAAVIAAVAAFRGTFQAEEYIQFLKATKRDSYSAGEGWKASRKLETGWKRSEFDDIKWSTALCPAPDRQTLTTEESGYQTMSSRDGSAPGSVYFRRTIDVPDRDRIERVTIISASDDDHRLYLNGTAVVSDADHSAGPVLFTDVTPFVKTGRNCFAVDAVNDSAGAWLVVNIQVQRK